MLPSLPLAPKGCATGAFSTFRAVRSKRSRSQGVIALDPEVVVMDEPSANLDNRACAMLADAVATLKRQGRCVVVAEHRMSYLMGVADRIVCMEGGRIVEDVSASEFAGMSYEESVAKGAAASRYAHGPLERGPAGKPGGGRRTGALPEGLPRSAAREPRTKMARTRPVSRWTILQWRSRGRFALRNLSFSATAPRGEVVAVIGANGAGKTTLVRALAGLQKRVRATFRFRVACLMRRSGRRGARS